MWPRFMDFIKEKGYNRFVDKVVCKIFGLWILHVKINN